MAKLDLRDLKLDEMVGELKGQLRDRADDLLGEGRSQARRAVGGHDDSAMFGTFVLGMLVGALVGAAVALLMTPLSGEEARRKLAEGVDKVRSQDQATAPEWETGGSVPSGNGSPSYQAPTAGPTH